MSQYETSPVWQNYIDLSDAKGWLQIPTTDTTRDTDLQSVIDAACWWVQEYLGRPIAPTQFFRRFSGYTGLNGSMINLPYYPVLQIPSVSPVVVEYWGLNSGSTQTDSCGVTNGQARVTDSLACPPYVGATVTGTGVPAGTTILSVVPGVEFTMSNSFTGSTGTQSLSLALLGHLLTEQTPASQGAPGTQVFQCDYPHGVLIRSFQGLIQRPWFPGLRNIEVTWTAGYDPIPPTIKLATREYIKYWWANTQESSRSFRARGEYDDLSGPVDDMWPAVERKIRAMLAPYVQVAMG